MVKAPVNGIHLQEINGIIFGAKNGKPKQLHSNGTKVHGCWSAEDVQGFLKPHIIHLLHICDSLC